MKSYCLVALFVCSIFGCGGSRTPSQTFHLKVELDPANNDKQQETVISFHSPSKAEIAVEVGQDRDSITFDGQNPNEVRECVLRLAAKRQEKPADGKSKVEVLIRQETPNGGSAGGPSIYTVDADKSLNAILAITVAEGDFALNEPVKLGTLNGVPITLVVRRI